MVKVEWHEAFDVISPYVVKIATPRGSGTGFLFAHVGTGGAVGIATAAHVVDSAHAWEEPLRIEHHISGKNLFLRPTDRSILLNPDLDTAAVIFAKSEIPFPETVLDLTPEGKSLKVGFEVGWVGFPALASNNLCLFSGRVSNFRFHEEAYLVDGVAINGVSGGPAFHLSQGGGMVVVGVVSAYVPNRATGEVLPGLCIIRHVRQLTELVSTFKSLAEARASETPPETVSDVVPAQEPPAEERASEPPHEEANDETSG